ncbi:unnamed protein product [Arctia plantaginis]|uniref:Uncharacterized protein n=1 Tax=Arctia plantaginis TaxID=874455 RepID=A0A8S1B9Q2_ARCPL|nr:unnamed protein product [Arctia plantaginis]
MGDDSESKLKMRHSFCTPRIPKHLPESDNSCKSDINFLRSRQIKHENIVNNLRNLGEYYKKYEHDEIPVKDSKFYEFTDVGDRRSLTNSELDKLEMKIFKNISQELQTDDNSLTSLESNIKFFKTTVQEIFDNFYASMRDFELYKKRFYEILAKNDTEAVADMEDFIKDMIQHIMSSDTSISNESKRSCDSKSSDHSKKSDDSLKDNETESSIQTSIHVEDTFTLTSLNKKSDIENLAPIVEAYKNEEYLTDSTLNEKKVNKEKETAKEEVFNIYLLSGNPCVQIKMNDRNLLSEINIKKPSKSLEHGKQVASAENMIQVAAKKMELKKYVEQEQEECDVPDREIPVKVSCAKKNIYLNEDFSHDRESEKSFISKICNFLCRKFRKS